MIFFKKWPLLSYSIVRIAAVIDITVIKSKQKSITLRIFHYNNFVITKLLAIDFT